MEPTDSNFQSGTGRAGWPPAIPDHQLLQSIGRGSYGTVWLARSRLGVYRAVKFVDRRSFDNQKPFDREWAGIRKFEPISRSHEGFIDILQVGINREAGYFYYVMELGDDVRLGQKIDPEQYQARTLAGEIKARHQLPFEECLRMGLALSLALAEVHKHGLVHRDVKPANVIYVNGVPKLADIGLVAQVGEAPSYVGTEGFIPPEGPGTPQADVYGLGKVLYEASTGRDRLDFPELPTRLGEMVQENQFLELNEVLLRACNRDITVRYETAWELYAHLLVLADGKSVKRLNNLERRLGLAKRAAAILVVLLVVLAGVGYHFYREWRFRVENQQRLVDEALARGLQAVESGDPFDAVPAFAEGLSLDRGLPEHELANRLRFGSALAQAPKLTHFWMAEKTVLVGSFDNAGNRVLIAEDWGKAKLYDLRSQQLIGQPFAQDKWLTSAAFSPDGLFAVTTSQGAKPCVVWDLARNKIILTLQHPAESLNASYSHDGKHIVTCGLDNVARVWNSVTGSNELTLAGHTAPVTFADFSHDDRMIVTTSRDGTARLWDARNGNLMISPLKHGGWVNHAAFSPDDERILTAGTDGTARVWRISGEPFPLVIKHLMSVSSAEFSPDGRLILTASLDGTVCLWNSDDLQPATPTSKLKLAIQVRHACFNPAGDSILAVCEDGSVRVWSLAVGIWPQLQLEGDFCNDGTRCFVPTNQIFEVRESASGKLLSQIRPIGDSAHVLNSSADGRFVLTAATAETVVAATNLMLTVWDSTTGSALAPGIQFSNRFDGAALSSDGKRFLLIAGNIAQTWDTLSGRPLSVPVVHKTQVISGSFSADNRTIVSVDGSEACVWDASDGHLLFQPLQHPCQVTHVEFSPDGTRLVSACADPGLTKRFAQIWDARSGAPGVQVSLNDGVLYACFSPDGKRIGTGDEDFTAVVWDAKSGRRLTPFLKHSEKVKMLAFSPDGKWIVTVCSDKTVRIWDSETGDPLTPKFPPLDWITQARFLPDWRIVTGGNQGRSRVWKLPINQYPIVDAIRMARLSSSGRFGSPENQANSGADSLAKLWQDLKGRYSSDFIVSSREIEAWHELEATKNNRGKHWSAEAFHLRILLALRPNDQEVVARLNDAKVNLRDSESTSK